MMCSVDERLFCHLTVFCPLSALYYFHLRVQRYSQLFNHSCFFESTTSLHCDIADINQHQADLRLCFSSDGFRLLFTSSCLESIPPHHFIRTLPTLIGIRSGSATTALL